MITYKPLRVLLAERDMDINQLDQKRGGVINGATVHKFRHDKSMNIESIAKVCMFLDVPIDEVVSISDVQ